MACKEVFLVFLGAFLFLRSVIAEDHTEGCLVRKYLELADTRNKSILSYIKLDGHLHFVVAFQNQDITLYRDWVNVSNSKVEYTKVRDGKGNTRTQSLQLIVPEGWHKLRLEAVDTRFELTLLSGDKDETTLYNLALDFPVSSVHVEGMFALCSEGYPEWEVKEGEEQSVLLQPQNNQQLEVRTKDDAKPYLVEPSLDSNPQRIISGNTNLTIVIKMRRTAILVEVRENNETLAEVKQRTASPTVVIGCHNGTLLLRLIPYLSATKTTSNNLRSADTPDFMILLVGGSAAVVVSIFFGFLAGFLSSRLCERRKRRKKAAPSDAAKPRSSCEEELLGKLSH